VRPRPGAREQEVRGVVLAVLGDDVSSTQLLSPGARLEGLRGRLRALASQVLETLDPGFAARARACGGGILIAGERFARGEPRAPAAACLAELGVRAVLARSFAPGAARTLVHAGLLPMRCGDQAGGPVAGRGDEVELPALEKILAAAGTLVARNLTCGSHLHLRHDLSPRERLIVQAGGLLGFVREGGAVEREEG
jgi:aconitate hydratase